MHRILPALATIVTLGTGCHVSRLATAEVPVETRVTVQFSQPTVVPVRTGAPESTSLAGVTELRGRVDSVTADTVYVRISGASGPDLAVHTVPINGVAAVARRSDTSFTERKFSGGRTTALVLGTATAIGLAFAAYLLVFFNPT